MVKKVMLKQKQSIALKTTLSKRMQESIAILAMPTEELLEHIELELSENPFLERDYESEYESTHEQIYAAQYKETLQDHLLSQLPMLNLSDQERASAMMLIYSLNENGFLAEVDVPDGLEPLRKKLMQLEPVGVFSYSIKECLLTQLKQYPQYDWETFLDHLDLLRAMEYQKLAQLMGVDKELIKKMIEIVSRLNFYPASNFEHKGAAYSEPDIIIVQENGRYIARLNEAALPKLMINNVFYEGAGCDKNEFSKKYYKRASFLMKAITQRCEALLKVSEYLCSHQYGFFKNGVNSLKAMVLREVASATQLSESTISRLGDRLVAYPGGVMPLKSFFSSGVKSALFDEAISSKVVQNAIKDLVANEYKINKILSDDEIAAELRKKGMAISRRTVNKYRDLMQIPPSNIRKRQMRA